jgi:hypothetical protein
VKILPKTYKFKKNKNYIKINNLFFFFNGVNRNSTDWITTEQKLKTYNFNYYKIFNKTILITLNKSIYCNIKSSIISSLVLLVKPEFEKSNLNKKIILNKLDFLNFILLSINLNNKIYSVVIIKEINSFRYFSNNLLLYSFLSASLKIANKKLKNRNNVI